MCSCRQKNVPIKKKKDGKIMSLESASLSAAKLQMETRHLCPSPADIVVFLGLERQAAIGQAAPLPPPSITWGLQWQAVGCSVVHRSVESGIWQEVNLRPDRRRKL